MVAVNTEVDTAVEQAMEADVVLNTVEAMVIVVMLSTFRDRRCLYGHIEIQIC
jgi:hypothetical protein